MITSRLRSPWIPWVLNPMVGETQRVEAETGGSSPKAGSTWGPQNPEVEGSTALTPDSLSQVVTVAWKRVQLAECS